MARDVAEQMPRMGFVTLAKRRVCERTLAQTLRLVESVEQQSGPSHRLVGHENASPPPRLLPLEERLALPESGQRLPRLAELGENPGGGGDHGAKAGGNAPLPEHRHPVLAH